MRHLLKFIPLFIILFSCSDDEIINPLGNVTKSQKVITDFTSLDVANGFNISITFGNNEGVEVETNENIQQYVIVEKVGNIVKVYLKPNYQLSSTAVVKINIAAKKIENLKSSGGSNIVLTNGLNQPSFSFNFSGGSDLQGVINAIDVTGDCSGGSELNLTGKATSYELSASGGVNANGYDFKVDNFKCQLTGGGTVNVGVNNKLNVTASGGSVVNYKGAGVIESQNLTGGSKINKIL